MNTKAGRWAGGLLLLSIFVLPFIYCHPSRAASTQEASAQVPTEGGPTADALGLTDEEKAFLADREVRLGVDSARPPFEFFDKTGLYSGISAGFVEAVAKRLGLTMVPLRDMAWTEAMGKVKTGDVDVIPKATPTAEREKYLTFTRPYVTFPTVIVTGNQRYISGLEDIHGLKVGVVKGLVPEANLRKDHPDMPLARMPDLEAGLRALSTGTLDAFVDNLGAITYTIDSLGLTNLKIAAPTPYTQDLAMGVRKDWPLLASALDKALASMSGKEKAEIKSRWLAIQVQAKTDWLALLSWLGPLAAGLLAVLAVVVRANRKLGGEVAERKRTEQRFAAMAANVPGAIFQMAVDDGGGRYYVYLSSRGEEFFGVEAEVAVKERRLLSWHPEDRQRVDREIAADVAAGVAANLVGRIVLPDGREKWVNLTASPNRQPDGRLLYDGFILDITQRKLAELEYVATERKIKAMSQAVDDALVMLDSRGKVLFWNPAAERLFGYQADEAVGMDFHSMAAPEKYRDKARRGLEGFARDGQGPVLGVTTEIQAIDRTGRLFPVEVTLSSFQIDEEWFAVGTVRDISARKQAEALTVAKEVAEESAARAERARLEAETARAEIERYKGRLELLVAERTEELKISEERSRLLLHSVGEGIFGVDARGDISFINPAALAMLGFDEDEVLGKGAHGLIHHSRQDGSPYPEAECPMHASFAEGATHNVTDEVLWRKDGQAFSVEYSSTPIAKDGGIMGAVVTFRDISQRKKAEEEMRQYMEDLRRFNQLTLGREVRMIELKEEINDLLQKAGQGKKYKVQDQSAS